MLCESQIVKLCLDASYGDYPWDRLLEDLTEWLDGDKSMLMHSSGVAGYNKTISHGHDDVAQRLYNQHYYQLDPRAEKSLLFKAGEASTGQEIVRNESFRNTAYFSDVTIAGDVKDSVHGVIADDIEMGRRAISIQRGFKAEFFGETELKKLRFILPHLERALRGSLRLTRIIAMEKSEAPLVYGLIDPSLQMHFFDSINSEMVDDLPIDAAGQRLRVKNKILETMLPNTIRRAGQGQICTIQLANTSLSLSRPPSALGWMGLKDIALFVLSRRQSNGDAKLFSEAFDLTPRECEVLETMLVCDNREKICQKLGISAETLRWHIKNILSKTGYNKSTQLVNAARQNDLSNCS